MPVHAIVPAHDDVRRARDRVDVAVLEYALDEKIVGPSLVHQAGRVGQRAGGVDDRRQHFEIDADRVGKVLRFRARGCDAGGNGFADISHLLPGKRRIARNLEAGHLRHRAHLAEAWKITRGEDPSTGIGRNRDAFDVRMGVRAADKGHVLHAGKLHVGNELPAPAQMARILLAQKRGADARGGVRGGVRHAVVFWSIATANTARSQTFQAGTGALSTTGAMLGRDLA